MIVAIFGEEQSEVSPRLVSDGLCTRNDGSLNGASILSSLQLFVC